jgi:hypothetical protein
VSSPSPDESALFFPFFLPPLRDDDFVDVEFPILDSDSMKNIMENNMYKWHANASRNS